VVQAPGDNGLAVGAERHRLDRRLMRQGLAAEPARRGIPEPRPLGLPIATEKRPTVESRSGTVA
jgi:hypothetical protein